MCTYKKNSIEPCSSCPKVMSALHRCELLKETHKELVGDSNEND